MVSRDTLLHAAIVLLVVVVAVGAQLAVPDLDSTITAALGLLLYGLVLSGAHLILAWRGEGGPVPVSSRWRFVALVTFVLVLASVAAFTDPVWIGDVSSDALLTALAAAGVVSYWVLEARSGYREASGR